jgi:F-type H+-transporting ATPase subunit alpha
MISSLNFKIFSAWKAKRFSQFGADIDQKTREIISYGEKITEILRQGQHQPLSLLCQVLLLFAIRENVIRWLPNWKINSFREKIVAFSHSEKGVSFQKEEEINFNSSLSSVLKEKLLDTLREFIFEVVADIHNYKFEDYGSAGEWKKFCD